MNTLLLNLLNKQYDLVSTLPIGAFAEFNIKNCEDITKLKNESQGQIKTFTLIELKNLEDVQPLDDIMDLLIDMEFIITLPMEKDAKLDLIKKYAPLSKINQLN